MPRERIAMRKVKEVLRLRYELGMSYSQIRQSCGVSLGTVNNLLARAEQAGLTTRSGTWTRGHWRSGCTSAPMTAIGWRRCWTGRRWTGICAGTST
jgi:hypothetical protein